MTPAQRAPLDDDDEGHVILSVMVFGQNEVLGLDALTERREADGSESNVIAEAHREIRQSIADKLEHTISGGTGAARGQIRAAVHRLNDGGRLAFGDKAVSESRSE